MRPVSVPMLAEAVRESAEDGRTMLVHGGRTKLGWLLDRGAPIDHLIDMTGLSGIISHDHGDMTATVQAGTPLASVQAAAAERNQRLAIDPPLGPQQAATVGGVFASNDAGPGRMAYGSLRELCIGTSFITADGTSAKSGSKVIKNVAGFDLCKLLCGSRGTLAIVTQLTVRLHPQPAAETTVQAHMSAEAATRAGQLIVQQLTVDGLTYAGDAPDAGSLWVRCTGPLSLVRDQAARARTIIEGAGGDAIRAIDDEESRVGWAEMTETRAARPEETAVAITVPVRDLSAFVHRLASLAPTGLGARVVFDLALGAGLMMLAPDDDPQRHAQAVKTVRETARAFGGHARCRDAPAEVRNRVDPFGPLPSGMLVMTRIKAALDPDGRLSPGRYLTNP